MGRFFLAIALTVPGLAAADVLPPMPLELHDAMVTQAKKGGSAAVSGEIWNTGDEDVVLTQVASQSAGQVLVQVYGADKDGLRQVTSLPTLTVPAKTRVDLEPGRRELRLVGLNADMEAGNEIALLVKDVKGRAAVWRVKIIRGYGK